MIEDEELAVEPDDAVAIDAVDDAPDAIAAIHEAGGDADRAETILETSRRLQFAAPVSDDDRST